MDTTTIKAYWLRFFDLLEISAAVRSDWDDSTKELFQIYVSEASYWAPHIATRINRTNANVLEIGSGLGIISVFLASLGHRVTSLEPSASGFNLMSEFRQALHPRFVAVSNAASFHLPKEVRGLAEEARLPKDFHDFAFSINVLEHVDSPRTVISRVSQTIKSGGVQWHTCPNYAVPYEPHFGILLVRKPKTKRDYFVPNSIRRSDLWQTLNFISYSEVLRIATSQHLKVTFDPGLGRRSYERALNDERFRHRHRLLVTSISLLPRSLLARLMGLLPARFSSPMAFSLENQ